MSRSRHTHTPLIIFDFDGVISDSVEMYAEAYHKTFAHFDKKTPFTDIQSFRRWYDSAWENNWQYVEEVPLEKAVVKFMSFVAYDFVRPFEGIGQVLSRLHSSASLVIASTTPSSIIQKFLEEHSLDSWVRKIYSPTAGSDKMSIFRSAIRDFSGDSSLVAVVGDTPNDIRPARALGCFSVASMYGWYDEERLLAETPDAAAHVPSEIIPALEFFLAQI